jgi:hypothetical protein
MRNVIVLLMSAVFVVTAYADPPPWAKGKGHGRERAAEAADEPHGRGEANGRRFEDRHRVLVREYYAQEWTGGRCPPGLAKKRNGCMPPGQAKKWRMGRPLPRHVVFYPVPAALVVRLGDPGPDYRYVRVAADILLIATGTRMVVDAIQDLGRG